MSITSASRLAILAALAAIVGVTLVATQGRAQAEDPVAQITAAPDLTWGFKKTWRNYAGEPQVSGGAAIVPPSPGTQFNLSWAFESGSYDPNTQTTQVNYGGSAHWTLYKASQLGYSPPPGYSGEPDPYILDVTLSDPQITISKDSSVLTVVATSRDRDTWELVSYGRIPLVNLDVIGTTPTVAGGNTEWSGIAATVAEQGKAAMADNYQVGQVVDPLAFSYAGPGGAPDFSERWDQPGAAALKLVQNALFIDNPTAVNLQNLWVDRQNMIVHAYFDQTFEGVAGRRYIAFSLGQMRQVATIHLPSAEAPELNSIAVFDPGKQRLLFAGSGESGMRRFLRLNLAEEKYETGQLADPQTAESRILRDRKPGAGLGPDQEPRLPDRPCRPRRGLGKRLRQPRVAPAHLRRRRGRDLGEEVVQTAELPGRSERRRVCHGLVQNADLRDRLGRLADRAGVDALGTGRNRDDSGRLPDRRSTRPTKPPTCSRFPALRYSNNSKRPAPSGRCRRAPTGTSSWCATVARQTWSHCRIETGTVGCDPPAAVRGERRAAPLRRVALRDRPRRRHRLVRRAHLAEARRVQGRRLPGGQFFKERNPRGGPVLVGADHFVYAQTSDGSPGEVGRLENLGLRQIRTARVRANGDRAATARRGLTRGGRGLRSRRASARPRTGDPAPQRQWQVKVPGSNRFADLAGETGETLSVAATRGDDGTEYRAVYSNAAGKVASDAAALSVEYAPARARESRQRQARWRAEMPRSRCSPTATRSRP